RTPCQGTGNQDCVGEAQNALPGILAQASRDGTAPRRQELRAKGGESSPSHCRSHGEACSGLLLSDRAAHLEEVELAVDVSHVTYPARREAGRCVDANRALVEGEDEEAERLRDEGAAREVQPGEHEGQPKPASLAREVGAQAQADAERP